MSAGPSETALPVTIIGGYLGAGKTTLINRILRQADGTRLAVLVNDFGDIAIDADLIESADDQVLNLAGGCVCCSIGSDLVATLSALRERLGDIDHVLLETSGVALPGVVAATVSLAPQVRRHAVIVVIDLLNGPAWLADRYIGDTVERQIAAADILLLNKQSLADEQSDEQSLSLFTQRLREFAPNAPQLFNDEQLPIASLLDFAQVDKRIQDTLLAPTHTPDYVSATFSNDGASKLVEFKAWVESGALELVRAKGFLSDADDQTWLVQVVGGRCELQRWSQPALAADQLVVITRRTLESVQLANAMAAFGLHPHQSFEQQTQ